MAFVVLVIEVPSKTIGDMNALQNHENAHSAIVRCKNLLQGILGGTTDAEIQVTTRDTDPAVGTSGAGSTQEDYNLR